MEYLILSFNSSQTAHPSSDESDTSDDDATEQDEADGQTEQDAPDAFMEGGGSTMGGATEGDSMFYQREESENCSSWL